MGPIDSSGLAAVEARKWACGRPGCRSLTGPASEKSGAYPHISREGCVAACRARTSGVFTGSAADSEARTCRSPRGSESLVGTRSAGVRPLLTPVVQIHPSTATANVRPRARRLPWSSTGPLHPRRREPHGRIQGFAPRQRLLAARWSSSPQSIASPMTTRRWLLPLPLRVRSRVRPVPSRR